MLKLNLGCNQWKLSGFENIDIDPKFKPDRIVDLLNLQDYYEPNSVDFIYAGHILEHFDIENSNRIARVCFEILKPCSSLMTVVPDYSKTMNLSVEMAEKVILADGEHKAIFNENRMYRVMKQAGFRTVTEITKLNEVPFIIVPNINNPVPEPWQTAHLSLKI